VPLPSPHPEKAGINLLELVIGELVGVECGEGVPLPNVENLLKLLSSNMGSNAFWHLKLYEKSN
jgi:hypothetical protein